MRIAHFEAANDSCLDTLVVLDGTTCRYKLAPGNKLKPRLHRIGALLEPLAGRSRFEGFIYLSAEIGAGERKAGLAVGQ